MPLYEITHIHSRKALTITTFDPNVVVLGTKSWMCSRLKINNLKKQKQIEDFQEILTQDDGKYSLQPVLWAKLTSSLHKSTVSYVGRFLHAHLSNWCIHSQMRMRQYSCKLFLFKDFSSFGGFVLCQHLSSRGMLALTGRSERELPPQCPVFSFSVSLLFTCIILL